MEIHNWSITEHYLGVNPENSERGGPLANHIVTFYFSENSIKIIQNLKEKGVAAAPFAHP